MQFATPADRRKFEALIARVLAKWRKRRSR